eukprot:CAMPEP_0180172346 /NCGR_PEP_ID=MMETSP0986-20121125/34966_1 /TAXON_ID=697907 /ORGANISM="non described non described, Strain CCMP2293" /LENGTH=578 /DNA_ID=CAMNT_0022124407 /DNA_START=30 /DNA_END=1766 /DNA_ORIENTATION=-
MVQRRPIVALIAPAVLSCLSLAAAFSPSSLILSRANHAGIREAGSQQWASASTLRRPATGRTFALGGVSRLGAARLRPVAGLRMCEEVSTEKKQVVAAAVEGADARSQRLFDENVEKGEAKSAVKMMRSTESLSVTLGQAEKLLSSIPLDLSAETETEQQILTSITYSSLRKRGLLRGFGCVDATPLTLPYANKEIGVEDLESVIGMPIQALTPKGSQFAWQFAGLALCAGEFFIGKQFGLDPLTTLIPATSLLFILDRALLSGAVFEAVYRTLFPQYREKVIRHEAGHFLLAYLLGCPIQGFFLSAWDANRVGIRGQAGTVFFDNDLSTQLTANKVTRTAIDRFTIVLMGGIAAEAMTYQQAEGGAGDESALVSFLVALTPPWDQPRVLNQARWAVTEAVLLLQEHKGCYDALFECMAANKGLGECVLAIEKELDAFPQLPSVDAAAREVGAAGQLLQTEAQVGEKVAKLDALTKEEDQIRDAIRKVQAEVAAAEAGTSKESSPAWSAGETQRFMNTLLRAKRKAKALEDGKGVDLDFVLKEAVRSRDLAKVDLQLAKNQAELADVERRLKDVQARE